MKSSFRGTEIDISKMNDYIISVDKEEIWKIKKHISLKMK